MYPYYPPPYPYYGPHHLRPMYPPPYVEDDGEYDEQMVGYSAPSTGHYIAGNQVPPSNAIIRVGSARGQRSHPARHFGPRTMQSQTLDQTIVSNILDRLESIESKLPAHKDIADPSSEHALAQLKLREDRLKEAEAELAKRSVQLDEKASALQKLSHELAKQASMIDTLTKTGAASSGGSDNDPALKAEMEKIIKSQEGVIKEWQTIWGVINDVFFKFYNICAMTLPGIPEHNFNPGDPMAIVVAMQHLITGFASSVLPKEEIEALNAQRGDGATLGQEVNQETEGDDDDPDNLD
ncbi:Hypothetical protein GLP15_1537 [Giardia lamblia P15]|uniref:Uncharacterized protein n=1 Tax=Giardia intestinalis (strain P15) TaxID=658858 RepID=E1EXL1_GIAIA|nr:Hypothetical protein GLP15_1537 [Giardia lamblia P15]